MASEDGGAAKPTSDAQPTTAKRPRRKKRGAPTLIGMAVAKPDAEDPAKPPNLAKPASKGIPAPKGFGGGGSLPKAPSTKQAAKKPASLPPKPPAPKAPAGNGMPPKLKAPPVRKRRPPAKTVEEPNAVHAVKATVDAKSPARPESVPPPVPAAAKSVPPPSPKSVPPPSPKSVPPPPSAKSVPPPRPKSVPPPGLGSSATEAALGRDPSIARQAEEANAEIDALVGERTSVTTTTPEMAGATTDMVDAPPPLAEEPTRPEIDSSELAFARTRPAAEQPPAQGLLPTAGATEPEDGGFKVGPTVVVDPAALQEQQQLQQKAIEESGEAPLVPPIASSATAVTERPPKQKSSAALFAGIGVGVVLLLSALGALVYFLVLRGDDPADPVAVADDPPTVEPQVGDPTSAEPGSEDVDPGEGSQDVVVAPPSGAVETDEPEQGEDVGDDPEPEEHTGPVLDLETLEGAEPDLPSVSRRARRMTEAQRRQMASRFRGQAIRRYRAEEWQEAERLYREALTYNNWDVAAVQGVARSLAQLEQFPLALAYANLALERNPRSAASYRIVGDIYRQAGHPDAALRAYRRGLHRHPDDRHLRARVRDVRQASAGD